MTVPNPNPSSGTQEGRPVWTAGRMVTLIVAILMVGLLGIVWFRASATDGSGASGIIAIGERPPDFALPGLDGETVRLSDYRGQVVLVNFWATWCPPCAAEMPELQAVYQSHRDAGFVIIGVDQAESADVVRSYVEERGFNWTFALDQSGDTSRDYGVYGIPESLLIDREGNVAYVWHGALVRSSLEQRLADLGI